MAVDNLTQIQDLLDGSSELIDQLIADEMIRSVTEIRRDVVKYNKRLMTADLPETQIWAARKNRDLCEKDIEAMVRVYQYYSVPSKWHLIEEGK